MGSPEAGFILLTCIRVSIHVFVTRKRCSLIDCSSLLDISRLNCARTQNISFIIIWDTLYIFIACIVLKIIWGR